jgi:hypothetical protein
MASDPDSNSTLAETSPGGRFSPCPESPTPRFWQKIERQLWSIGILQHFFMANEKAGGIITKML